MTFGDSFIVFFIKKITLRELILAELSKGALNWRNLLPVRMAKGSLCGGHSGVVEAFFGGCRCPP